MAAGSATFRGRGGEVGAMKIAVVMWGHEFVQGVFHSVDRAKANWPTVEWRQDRDGEWSGILHERLSNGAETRKLLSIEEHELR
jgi:hypothetical protein